MKIVRDFSAPADGSPLALTVGNFDGMHLGHQALLKEAAAVGGGVSGVMSFEPHPLTVLQPQTGFCRLYDFREKFRWCEKLEINFLFLIRFNKSLSCLSDNDFNDILFERMRVKHLLVGENFRYGAGGRGDLASLRTAARRTGATVVAAPLVACDGAVVSSGRVRTALADGDFALAARLLGRFWSLEGRVVRGDGRGRQWGFPTANIALRFVPPCRGIFAVWATADDGRRWRAAVSIGTNPMFDGGGLRVEAFLLDFDGDLYGRRLRLEPRHKLRDEKSFASTQALVDGITADVAKTAVLLKV